MNDKHRNSLTELFFEFLQTERGLSQKTIETYRNGLKKLVVWNKNKNDLKNLIASDLQDFIIETSRVNSRRSVHNFVSAIKTFFKYLLENKHIQADITNDLVLPKLERVLPKILNRQQIELLLSMPEILYKQGEINERICVRDKMILEIFYGSGLRISELRNLKNSDIDCDEHIIKVLGKGGKERLSPCSTTSLLALQKFWNIFGKVDNFLLSIKGKHLTVRQIQNRVKFYLKASMLPADLSPHTIRHAYATHMLNAGADLRLIQELLGHASLSTTQIYTHVDSAEIKNVHSQCHPHG